MSIGPTRFPGRNHVASPKLGADQQVAIATGYLRALRLSLTQLTIYRICSISTRTFFMLKLALELERVTIGLKTEISFKMASNIAMDTSTS